MGMSNLVLDNEDMFYEAAGAFVHECDTVDEFVEMMMKQRDLVVHQSEEQIVEALEEIWSEMLLSEEIWSEMVL